MSTKRRCIECRCSLPHLVTRPRHPYDTARVVYRVCDLEGFVAWEGNRYSLPIENVTELLPVRITQTEIFVYAQHLKLVARHELRPRGASEDVIAPGHRPKRDRGPGLDQLRIAYRDLGAGADEFLARTARDYRSCLSRCAGARRHLARPRAVAAVQPILPAWRDLGAISPEHHSMSVEGIWQALKVFEHADVDPSKLRITNMKGIKRTTRRFGRVLGHREGLTGTRLLSYVAARRRIYLPSYRWVLEHALDELVGELAQRAARDPVVLLDYETNEDVSDVARPLSHVALIASYVARIWPDETMGEP
jgi:hypothetical protein